MTGLEYCFTRAIMGAEYAHGGTNGLMTDQSDWEQARRDFPGATLLETEMVNGVKLQTITAPTRIPQHPRQVTTNG